MITRRQIVAAFGASALAVPLIVRGQTRKVRRIGYLANDADPRKSSPTFKSLQDGLRELGWVEGRNIEVRIRASGGSIELFPQLAAELVRENVEVIVTGGTPATRAAQIATARIPIVFASAADPVAQKLVASIERPGGNVTGIALEVQHLGPKRLELLQEMLPRAARVMRLYQAASIVPIQPAIISTEDTAARRLGIALKHVAVTNMASVGAAFDLAARNDSDAVSLTGAGLFVGNREAIAKLALAQRLPTMCSDGRFPDSGALASYGANFPLRYRRVAWFVDKILRGAHPAGMTVEQSADFEFVVNLRTAKALGVGLPKLLRIQADRIIE